MFSVCSVSCFQELLSSFLIWFAAFPRAAICISELACFFRFLFELVKAAAAAKRGRTPVPGIQARGHFCLAIVTSYCLQTTLHFQLCILYFFAFSTLYFVFFVFSTLYFCIFASPSLHLREACKQLCIFSQQQNSLSSNFWTTKSWLSNIRSILCANTPIIHPESFLSVLG